MLGGDLCPNPKSFQTHRDLFEAVGGRFPGEFNCELLMTVELATAEAFCSWRGSGVGGMMHSDEVNMEIL